MLTLKEPRKENVNVSEVWELYVCMYPVTRLDLADDPEEDIDVEEEESIG